MGQRNAIIGWIGIARGSQIRRNVMRNAVSPSLRRESFRNSLFHQSMILRPVSSLVCDGDRDDYGEGNYDGEHVIGARRVQSVSIVWKGKVPVRLEIQASEVGLGPVRRICVGQIVVEVDA